MKNSLFFVVIGLLSSLACSQPTNVVANQNAQFEVWGNCGMCKKTIEKAAKSVPGVASATWEVDSHQLSVALDSAQTGVASVHQAIATAGYDTDQVRGDDAAYQKLHSCCQYDRRK
jgi:periplasmic mercuric ion binding protein